MNDSIWLKRDRDFMHFISFSVIIVTQVLNGHCSLVKLKIGSSVFKNSRKPEEIKRFSC